MDISWLADLLPILNAAGIPLLAIGLILLIKAYQKSVDTYKDTTGHLREENERLRRTLAERDSSYFEAIDRVQGIASTAVEVMGQLQARKQVLLTRSEESSDEVILSDVAKINEVLNLVRELARGSRELEARVMNYNAEARGWILDLQDHIDRVVNTLGRSADRIGDTKSRVLIARLLIDTEEYEALKSQTAGYERGLTVPGPEPLEQLSEGDKPDSEPKLPAEDSASKLSAAAARLPGLLGEDASRGDVTRVERESAQGED